MTSGRVGLERARTIQEVEGLFRAVALNPFRKTAGVDFYNVPTGAFPRVDAIDRVNHVTAALSPGPVGDVARPWYMHPFQADHLVVLQGTRHVELYRREHGEVEEFEVSAEGVVWRGKPLGGGPALLAWPPLVFHRVRSGPQGSAAINFAVHFEGIDLRTNFNIYDLDTATGRFRTLREGYRDQEV